MSFIKMQSTRLLRSHVHATNTLTAPNPGDERKTDSRALRLRRPGPLNTGSFAADVASFGLHLAAENKAAATMRIYTEASRWFASAYLLPETDRTSWGQVNTQDVQRWVVWLLRHYSEKRSPAGGGSAGWTCGRSGSATTSATHGWSAAARRAT
jgi:hypothetical protein